MIVKGKFAINKLGVYYVFRSEEESKSRLFKVEVNRKNGNSEKMSFPSQISRE